MERDHDQNATRTAVLRRDSTRTGRARSALEGESPARRLDAAGTGWSCNHRTATLVVMVNYTLRVPENLYDKIKAAAERNRRSIHAEILWLLEGALEPDSHS